MVVDYDLSDLPYHQAEVLICLQANAICGQIMAAQAERLGFPLVLGDRIVSAMAQKSQTMLPALNEGRA